MIGLPSVGKSALARYLLHFANDRELFHAGVVLIQAKGLKDINVLRIIMLSSYLDETEKC